MTLSESIQRAIEAGDDARCALLLAPLTEAERRPIHSVAARCFQAANADRPAESWLAWRAKIHAAELALLGTATVAELRKLRWLLSEEHVFEVLRDRNPPWLADWTEWAVGHGPAAWAAARKLVRARLVPALASDEYIHGLVAALGTRPLRDWVRQEPDLLDEIWRLFEVEGSQQASLAAHDKYSRNPWSDGLVDLSSDGTLPRSRLLDASLDALERDFAPFRAGWFSRFHEQLKPTAAERTARAARYLNLVASRVPTTVSFATKAIASLAKNGGLDASMVSQIAPAASARQKSVAAQALALLDAIAQRHPASRGEVADAARTALTHDSPEIQRTALDLITRWAGADHAAAVAEPLKDVLAPSQRARIAPAAAEPAPVAPCRTRRNPIEPVATLDQLIDLFAAVLENGGPADDIERVLDAVSRLSAERPANFGPLTKPLAVRARKLAAKAQRGTPVELLAPLALSWICGEPFPVESRPHLTGFLRERVREVADRAAGQITRPLAAAPTHAGGWIDPNALVARLATDPGSGELDLIQALLRLAAEGREEALEVARSLPGEPGVAVRYALGGDGSPPDHPDPLWKAAEQARDPRATSQVQLGFERIARTFTGVEYVHWQATLENGTVPKDVRYAGELTLDPGDGDANMLRWCALVWPASRDRWFAAGARVIANNLDWWSAEWQNRVYLETLAEWEGPCTGMALQLLALGLACKEDGEGMAATDALISALEHAAVSGAELGEVCARIAASRHVTQVRWLKRFGRVARLNGKFARELFCALDRMLAAQSKIPPNELAAFLELLRELMVQGDHTLSRVSRVRLQKLQTTGKAGRLAREILSQYPG